MIACFVIIMFIILIYFLISKIRECEELKFSIDSEKHRANHLYELYVEELNKNSMFNIKNMTETSTRIQILTQENNLLKAEKSFLEAKLQTVITNNKNIPAGTIEAVRYAVKKSHPDNGGNSSDFIKFKKCLDELEGTANGR